MLSKYANSHQYRVADEFTGSRPHSEWGAPVPRVTFSFHQNERKMQQYLAQVCETIMRRTGASRIWTRQPGNAANRWAGGTRMGSDPKASVVNG
jgi:hypothetical protein